VCSEVAASASFDDIRYGQVWEDGDVLLSALDVQPGDVCLSIASAGDNALALLTRRPSRVIALDLSAAQLACLAVRVAAFQTLSHGELLELVGSRRSARRLELYGRCRALLSPPVQRFWDQRASVIRVGLASAGRFERYLRAFRQLVLPLAHSPAAVSDLLSPKTPDARRQFYDQQWNTLRWRQMFRVFFSRAVMGRFGRDPAFFRYAEGDVAERFLERTRHALVELDPSSNPWVHWIVRGTHADELPTWLRAEHFDTIREHLRHLEWRQTSLESFLQSTAARSIDRFNLSDVFEYMSDDRCHDVLRAVARAGTPNARLVYWNLLARRRPPASLANVLRPVDDLAAALHARDRTFFYSELVVEAIR